MTNRVAEKNNFELGDIVEISYNNDIDSVDRDLCLIYESINNEIDILSMIPREPTNCEDLVEINIADLAEGSLTQDYFVITSKIINLEANSTIDKIGRINKEKIDEILRRLINNLVEKHYHAIHEKDNRFIPEETYIHYAGRVYDDQELKILTESCLDFWLTTGRFAKQFEKEFSEFLGVKHCVLTNSGSSANLLAISALTSKKLGAKRLKQGDEVITTACAFPTTINPIIQNNLIPVFVDVSVGTYNILTDSIEDALSERTKAIFLAHTLGNPFNLEKVSKICKDHGLWLIEDNCDALGSKYGQNYTGSFGQLATFSFYPAHHITMGEGGAVVTNHEEIKNLIRSYRDWGRDCWCEPGCDNTCNKRFGWKLGNLPLGYDHKYIYSHIGYNLKLTDMQAAIGVAQLKKLSEFIEVRKKNFKQLYEGLKKFEKYFIFPNIDPRADPSWFGFVLSVRQNAGFTRDEIVRYLEINKIGTRMLFAGNILCHPSYNNVNYRVYGSLENTNYIMNNTFWIGVYPGIKPEMIAHIIRKFEDFIGAIK